VGGLNTFGTTSLYAGMVVPTPVSGMKFGASFDYVTLHNQGDVQMFHGKNPHEDSTWDVALYANFQATDKLSFNARGEYLDDSAGLIYGTRAEEVTLTTQYNLWANVISRVEFRWDHVEHGNAFDGNIVSSLLSGGGLSSIGPEKSNAFMLAFNVIYQF
jgi:hypothetical protein